MARHPQEDFVRELIHDALDPSAQFLKPSMGLRRITWIIRLLLMGILTYSLIFGVYLLWRVGTLSTDGHRIRLATMQQLLAQESTTLAARLAHLAPDSLEAAETRRTLEAHGEELVAVQTALKNGDAARQVSAPKKTTIRDALLAVNGAYTRLQGSINQIVEQSPDGSVSADELTTLSSANDAYRGGMEHLVTQLETFADAKRAGFRVGISAFTGFFILLVAAAAVFVVRPRWRALERTFNELDTYRMAIEFTGEHIVFADPDGRTIFANRAAELITGFSRHEMIGKRAGGPELWGGLMDNAFYAAMWRTIKKNRKVFKGTLTNRRKNGEKYEASVVISPVLDSKGEIQFFIGVERDLTQEG